MLIFPFLRSSWTTGEDNQILPATWFTGHLRFHGNLPESSWWRHCHQRGQTPALWSAMLWITSCPWLVIWMDPVGYHCSACTPSAASRSAFCRSWWDHEEKLKILPSNLGPSNSLTFSVYRKFRVTWPGCSPAWMSWGRFRLKAASEECPEPGSCCCRPCWTVCSSSSSTSGTPARAARPGATCLWRWDYTEGRSKEAPSTDWTEMSPQRLSFLELAISFDSKVTFLVS